MPTYTKWSSDAALDAILDYFATSTIVCVCSQDPATYAEMTTTYMLLSTTLTGADFTKAADTTGRKSTLTAKTAITITNAGTARVVCYGISASSTMTFRTTCTSNVLTAGGNTVTIPSWVIHMPAPV